LAKSPPIAFGLPGDPDPTPLFVITSGRHKVDNHLVAQFLNVEKLQRAASDFVREWSGFAIGGVGSVVSAAHLYYDESTDHDLARK
jgi:prolyl-tRNA editing enzyme YbaK/EbsC (Cys-tRNA(Pro) deacylase)